MAVQARGFTAFREFLEMIKFEHSIFALPFAMIGMIWASVIEFESPWPGWRIFLLIVLAMVSARSAAMAFNRIHDRKIDAKNPRTKTRAIPAGILSLRQSNIFFFGSCIVFFVAAGLINQLTLVLSPIALGLTIFYSTTKRFTALCHFVLGASLGVAPLAAWIAVRGRLDMEIVPLGLAVMFWTAGFDIIYSLQDEDFDKSENLRSLPESLGKANALVVSRLSHALCIFCFSATLVLVNAQLLTWLGLGFLALILAWEQSLVKPNDLSKVNMAFFTLNGFAAIGVFLFVLADVFL
jgi:4-hydroxybenzoate polyprenyltransferase